MPDIVSKIQTETDRPQPNIPSLALENDKIQSQASAATPHTGTGKGINNTHLCITITLVIRQWKATPQGDEINMKS